MECDVSECSYLMIKLTFTKGTRSRRSETKESFHPSLMLDPESERVCIPTKIRKPIVTKRRLHFTAISLLLYTVILFLLYNEQHNFKKNSLSCYYSEMGDALPSAEDQSFSPNAKSIFFHETSCRGDLTVRQACAVEAAARAHPEREIYVLFSAPVTDHRLKSGCLAELLKFSNVKFLRVHVAEYSKGTAVQSILLNDMKNSIFQIQHTADVLRMLTLNKWGGVYLDTDMIVTRSLEYLPRNFVAKESASDVASAILSFAKDEIGTRVTNEVIKEISKLYDPTYWSFIGAEAIQVVLERLCPEVVSSPGFQTKPFSNCSGVMIFDDELFYPHHFSEIDDIFNPAPLETFDLSRPYTYHMYDFLTSIKKIRRGTVYETVAKAFCPTIHSTFPHEFSGQVSN